MRRSCELYLERIQALFEEEKKEFETSSREALQDCGALVKSLEELFAAIEAGNSLQMLMAIQTEEDARSSGERKRAMDCIPDILFFLRQLETGTTITPERYKELSDRYTAASRAVGIIGKYGVDHTR